MRVGEGQSTVKNIEQYKCELLPEAVPVENKGVEEGQGKGLAPSGAGQGDGDTCLFPQRALCPPRRGTEALQEPSS